MCYIRRVSFKCKCGNYYIEWDYECDRAQPTDFIPAPGVPIGRGCDATKTVDLKMDFCCSRKCCHADLAEIGRTLGNFEAKWDIPPGGEWVHRGKAKDCSDSTTRKNNAIREKDMRKFHKALNGHITGCLQEFSRGRGMSSFRRYTNGGRRVPLVNLYLPPNTPPTWRQPLQQQINDTFVAESQLHEAFIQRYRLRSLPPYPVAPQFQPGSSATAREQEDEYQAAMRRYNREVQTYNEQWRQVEAGLASRHRDEQSRRIVLETHRREQTQGEWNAFLADQRAVAQAEGSLNEYARGPSAGPLRVDQLERLRPNIETFTELLETQLSFIQQLNVSERSRYIQSQTRVYHSRLGHQLTDIQARLNRQKAVGDRQIAYLRSLRDLCTRLVRVHLDLVDELATLDARNTAAPPLADFRPGREFDVRAEPKQKRQQKPQPPQAPQAQQSTASGSGSGSGFTQMQPRASATPQDNDDEESEEEEEEESSEDEAPPEGNQNDSDYYSDGTPRFQVRPRFRERREINRYLQPKPPGGSGAAGGTRR